MRRARARGHQLLSYWRSSTFSATVEPTIYLLAFGFGFGSLVATVGGYDYVEYVGTGTVATAVLFSCAFPGMFGTFVKYKFQRTYDAILAAPVDTEELVTAEALWIAVRAGVYGCAPMIVAIFFGLDPAGGCCSCRSSASSPASAGPPSGSRSPRGELDRQLQLRDQRGADAAVPGRRDVLPDRRAAGVGAGAGAVQPALPPRRARARRRVRSLERGRPRPPRRSWSSSAWSCGGWRSAGSREARRLRIGGPSTSGPSSTPRTRRWTCSSVSRSAMRPRCRCGARAGPG